MKGDQKSVGGEEAAAEKIRGVRGEKRGRRGIRHRAEQEGGQRRSLTKQKTSGVTKRHEDA